MMRCCGSSRELSVDFASRSLVARCGRCRSVRSWRRSPASLLRSVELGAGVR